MVNYRKICFNYAYLMDSRQSYLSVTLLLQYAIYTVYSLLINNKKSFN